MEDSGCVMGGDWAVAADLRRVDRHSDWQEIRLVVTDTPGCGLKHRTPVSTFKQKFFSTNEFPAGARIFHQPLMHTDKH